MLSSPLRVYTAGYLYLDYIATNCFIIMSQMLLLIISFLAGCLTILAPCVLPLLPIIVGSSVNNDNKDRARPYVIVSSLALSIIFFTLLLKVSTVLINLSPSVLTGISGGLLIALGASALFPELWEAIVIELNWQAKSQRFQRVCHYTHSPLEARNIAN